MDGTITIRGQDTGHKRAITAAITQWDYGYYFLPEIEDLPNIYRIDFSNDEKKGEALSVYGGENGAEVPVELINTGKDIYAFYFVTGTGWGRTERSWKIPNRLKPRPSDVEPTPAQQPIVDQLISKANEAITTAEQKAGEAGESALSAKDDADRAESARDTTRGYASNAQLSATQANNSASSAYQNAQASARNASEAEQDRIDADRYASASAQSASASANSASDAQGYANSASASAQSASGYASSAQTSAQTASTKATEASTSAQTASTKATEASQSASQALSYKTDAESAKTASQTAQGLAESARDSAVQAKTDAESAKADAESARDEAQQAVASISGALADKAPIITDTASGAIASFSDGADNLPLKSLIVDINPIQDLSNGDPSPTNICPISGWTEVNVNHSDADMTNPTTITINLGQTVYGGKLDVLSGELVIDRAMVDLGTLNWNKSGDSPSGGFIGVGGPTGASKKKAGRANIISDSYAPNLAEVPIPNIPNLSISGQGNNNNIYVRNDSATSGAEIKTMLSGVYACYELNTPVTIQLSANQLNSLYGQNNLWADSGDTTAEYRADTKLFIERLTAPDSADMIADANITSGQYFMVGNSLYKATANIANGGQIVVGTNCIRKSLSEALNEINA